MNVYFINLGSEQYRVVLTSVCMLVGQCISLPEKIEIEFSNLNESTYAELVLNTRYKNRIKINNKLSVKECINVLIHELLHLQQLHEGRLMVSSQGDYIWNKKSYSAKNIKNLTYKEYNTLPWELDVAQKQQKILKKILELGLPKG